MTTKKNPSRLIPSNELTKTQRKSLGLPRTTEHVKQPNATPPRIYVNSSTKGHYSGADLTAPAVRRGADDNKQIKTRGIEGT